MNSKATATRRFVPAYINSCGSSCYVLVAYTWDGSTMLAHFEDGHTRPSIWPTPEALLNAGRDDYRERVREVR